MGKTYIADKETLDKCYAILSADGIYGFIEHMDVLSPTARIEYIGQNKDFTPISLNKDTGTMTLNSWADFPIIVANKPWMVRADEHRTTDWMRTTTPRKRTALLRMFPTQATTAERSRGLPRFTSRSICSAMTVSLNSP